jgi:hypothetical protein
MKAKTLHYYSGILISIFVFMHLANHLVALVGAEKHIEIMDSFRLVYRNIVVESLLLGAVVVQIYSGITLYRKLKKSNGFEKIQVLSGLYLAFFLVIHVSAVTSGRLMDIDTNIYFAAGGLHAFPSILFFLPYYSLSVIAFFSHIAGVHYKKSQLYFSQNSASIQAKIIIVLGAITSFLIMFSMLNIEMPKN